MASGIESLNAAAAAAVLFYEAARQRNSLSDQESTLKTVSLFSKLPQPSRFEDPAHQPLAERMRPRTLDEFIGQEKLLGPGKPLRLQIENDNLAPCFCGARRAAAKPLSRASSPASRAPNSSPSAPSSPASRKSRRSWPRPSANPAPASAPSSSLMKFTASTRPSRTPFLPHVEAGHITLHRRHHRKSLLRSHLAAALAHQGLRPRSPHHPANRRSPSPRPR